MKVAVVAMSVSPVRGGGVAEKAVRLSRALADAGVSTTLVATDHALRESDPAAVADRLRGAELTLLPCLWERFYLPDPRPAASRPLTRAVRDADVVLLLNHWTLLNVLAWRRARRAGVPHVVLPAGALYPTGRSRLAKRLYDRLWGHRLVASAGAWIATTDIEPRDFAAHGVPRERVTVIPNGIDPPDPAATTAPPPPGFPDAPYVLFVGRLAPIKGPDLLLSAFRRLVGSHPDLHLVLAGPDDGMKGALRDAVGELSPRVHLPGYLDAEAKSSAYGNAILTVVPSRREAMSIVALEAAATGCPVLATDVCGLVDIDQVDGGRVVPATAEGLEAGLRDLLAVREELPAMGQRLSRHVLTRYGWDSLAHRYIELFEQTRCES